MKISILLSISNNALVPFLYMLPPLSHETTIFITNILWVVLIQDPLIMIDLLCKGNYVQRKQKGVKIYSILCVYIPFSQKKFGDA